MRPLTIAVGPTLLLACLLALTGCASYPESARLKPQYCYTNQTIDVKKGEKVSSDTRLECTDDPTKQLFQARSGISKDCREFYYVMPLRGELVERRGYACQKFSGVSEVFNPGQHR